MATPRLHLEPTKCPTCGQTILTADLDANQHGWETTLTIHTRLLTPLELAAATIAGDTIYRIHLTKTGKPVAAKHKYWQTPEYLQHREQNRIKYAQELGYARQHTHNMPDGLGAFIPLPGRKDKEFYVRKQLIRNAVEKRPDLKHLIRDITDPAPF